MRRRGDEFGYVGAGDGLRAIAALGVLVFHVYIAMALTFGDVYGGFGTFALHLNSALYVFFVLSGYLVGGPFVRAWLAGGPWPGVGRYVSKRLRRIVPAFWLVLAVFLVWFGDFGSSTGQVLALFGFAQVFDPGTVDRVMPQGWTLDVEMMFYVALPVLAFLGTRIGGFPRSAGVRRGLLFAFLAVVLVGGLALRDGGVSESNSSTNLATLCWAFVPGMLLAALEEPLRARLQGTALGRLAAWACALAAAAAYVLLMAKNPTLDSSQANLAFLVIGGGAVAGPVLWQWTTGWAPRLLDNRPMHALGRWSYGIYLVHVGIGLELLKHLPSGAGPNKALAFMAAGMLVGSVVAAALLWWLVEEPFIRRRAPRAPAWLPAPTIRRLSPAEEDAKGIFIAGDTLRAFASLSVLMAHVTFGVALAYGKSPLDAFGIVGRVFSHFGPIVFLFFTLSGYLVGGPFVRAWLRGSGRPDLRRYTSRRLRRIVPAFLVVCAVLLAYFGTYGSSTRQVVLLFAFGQNYDAGGVSTWMPQGWTLDVEMLFYIALPVVMLALLGLRAVPRSPRTRRVLLYGALAVLTVAGAVIRSSVTADSASGRNLISLLHAFTPGLLLAALEVDVRPRLRPAAGKIASVALTAAMLAGWAVVVAGNHVDGQPVFEIASIFIGLGLVGGPMLWQWATGTAPRWLSNRALHALGRWSYGIYLIHVGVLLIVLRHIPHSLGTGAAYLYVSAITIGVTVALAALLYWLIEEPFMGKQLPRRWWQALGDATRPPEPPSEERAPDALVPAPAAVDAVR